MKKYIKTSLFAIISLVLIILAFYLWEDYYRYTSYNHYHANFWLFINWEKRDFSSDEYMEDIALCKLWNKKQPEDRAHMHENDGWAIHIHDDWVTWWHFFSNIWYTFWEDFLNDDNWNLYTENENNKLTFLLNGQQIQNPFNRMIKSKDILLINYWTWNIDYLKENFLPQIETSADMYNTMDDPTTCSWEDFSIFKYINDNIYKFNKH